MNCSLGQYRASVGGFYVTSLRLSTLLLYFVSTNNIIPFLCLILKRVDGIGMALFYFFMTACIDRTEECDSQLRVKLPVDDYCFNRNLKLENNPSERMIDNCFILIFLSFCLLMLCGDIHPNPGPTNNDATLSIVHNNICSLRGKADLVYAELNNFDIITISETWLYDEFEVDKILMPGYSHPIRQDKSDNSGYNGVAIWVVLRKGIFQYFFSLTRKIIQLK